MDFDLLKPFCVKEMYKPQLLHVLQYIIFKAFNLHAGFSNVAETGVNQCNFSMYGESICFWTFCKADHCYNYN